MCRCPASSGLEGRHPGKRKERLRTVEDFLDDEQVATEAVERVMRRERVARRLAERPAVRKAFSRAQTERVIKARERTRKRFEIQRINEQAEALSVLRLRSDFTHGIGRSPPAFTWPSSP
ncbi:DUF6192 family protein [Streptomyces sp. NPDC008122]|uniref:DUF6192 family protein n=1 Tax=Streptomyces sp. NPDC008122 TaxID=3364810 RepID=UPI0036E7B19D